MKTLKNHTILYDEVCPLCQLYTKGFVRSGMLDEKGRQPFQSMPEEFEKKVDRSKAVNEIALVNKQTGEVYYGIESIFKILGNSFPFLRPVFSFRPVAWLSEKLYKFISFNRRVIVPSSLAADGDTCKPSFHAGYRLSYLVFAWLVTSYILSGYSTLLSGIVPSGNFSREFLICGGQNIWQLLILFITGINKKWDYLGNMMTISLGGSFLLLPAIILSVSVELSPWLYAAYFSMIAFLMLLEHIRRTKLLNISSWLTFTWILYRVILLFIII